MMKQTGPMGPIDTRHISDSSKHLVKRDYDPPVKPECVEPAEPEKPEKPEKPEHDTPWTLSGPNHDVCIVGASGEAVYRTRLAVERSSTEGKAMAHMVECVNARAKHVSEWGGALALPWTFEENSYDGFSRIRDRDGFAPNFSGTDDSPRGKAYREIIRHMNSFIPTEGGG